MTHLHSDHASGIAEFPGATFVLSSAGVGGRVEGRRARRLHQAPVRPRLRLPHARLRRRRRRLVRHASVARSTCSATAACAWSFTPGHTDGHCAVVLRLAGREALICGDAAYTMRTIEDSHLPFKMADEHRFRRSLKEIQLYIEQTPGRRGHPGPRHGGVAAARLDLLAAVVGSLAMSEWSDRELGMDRPITRRDFLDGVAVGAGALALGSVLPGCDFGGGDDESARLRSRRVDGPAGPDRRRAADSPPAARRHVLGATRASRRTRASATTWWWSAAGISGLAAARFFQREYGEDAAHPRARPARAAGRSRHPQRVHARRDRARACWWATAARSRSTRRRRSQSRRAELLDDVGVEVERFEKYFDQGFNKRHGLRHGFFFNKEDYGRDQLVFGDGRGRGVRAGAAQRARQARPDRALHRPAGPLPRALGLARRRPG